MDDAIPMDDVILNKTASIERCIKRVREEYDCDPNSFSENFTRQDAAILNIQRACEACLDLGQYLIRRHKLGNPQSSRDIFELLQKADWIEPTLAEALKKMVGFRNIAVHDYQTLQIPIVIAIIESHLPEFTDFTQAIIHKSNQLPKRSI